jgi:hypothetical protein
VIRRGHHPSGPQTNLALSNRLNYLKVDYAGQYRQELALLGGAVNPRTWFIKSRMAPVSCAKWRGTRCESPVPSEISKETLNTAVSRRTERAIRRRRGHGDAAHKFTKDTALLTWSCSRSEVYVGFNRHLPRPALVKYSHGQISD